VFVLKLGHGYVLIIVEFLIAEFLKNVEVLLHVSVAVDQFLELLMEHLQSVHMDEVLDVLQTHLKTVQVRAQLLQLLLKSLWSLRLHSDLLLKNLRDQPNQLLPHTRL
jgi:hypothetical protein